MRAALRVSSFQARTLLLATIKRLRVADGIECRFLDSFHRQGFMISTSVEIDRRVHFPRGFHADICIVVAARHTVTFFFCFKLMIVRKSVIN